MAVYKIKANSHDASRYECVSSTALRVLMLVHTSKSSRYLAIASCLAGLNGCASDGGVGELAAMGAILGSAGMGMDTGAMIAVATVATGALVVASASSGDPTTSTVSAAPSPVTAASTTSPSVSTNALATAPAVASIPVSPPQLEHCYVYLSSNGYEKNPDVLSPVFRDAQANSSAHSLVTLTKKFAQKVSAQQPGVWHDFEYKPEQCTPSVGVCSAAAQPLLGPNQSVLLRCFASPAEANDALAADKVADPTATTISMN